MPCKVSWKKWILVGILVLGYLWSALDGKHYWHDIRFLYATSQFPLPEIISGMFNPHQAWGTIDEVSASGFYSSKVLHIILLYLLYSVIEPAKGGMEVSVMLSVLLVTLTIVISYFLYFKLTKSKETSILAIISMILAPVMPYLSGKLLSEITSLLFVVIALFFMIKANNIAGRKSIFIAFFSGVFLTLAGLARLDSLFGPAGYAIAAVFFPIQNTRTSALRTALLAFGTFFVGYSIIITSIGIGFEEISGYFVSFTTAGQKSILMSLIGIVTFGGLIYVFALFGIFGIFGIFNEKGQIARFFMVWLLLIWVPVILITWNFMVEPRYLIQGILPLSGLSALGLEVLGKRIDFKKRLSKLVTVVLITGVIGTNYIVVRLMPYELDRPALLSAVSSIQERDNNAHIFIPWSYTDYNFLKVMTPDAPIYNVNSPTISNVDSYIEMEWKKRFRKWYGDRYISGPKELNSVISDGHAYYLGWDKYPPVQNVKDFVDKIELSSIQKLLNNLNLQNHLEQSWMWTSGFIFENQGSSGQYKYYRVLNR